MRISAFASRRRSERLSQRRRNRRQISITMIANTMPSSSVDDESESQRGHHRTDARFIRTCHGLESDAVIPDGDR